MAGEMAAFACFVDFGLVLKITKYKKEKEKKKI